jgi:hypothetical protein
VYGTSPPRTLRCETWTLRVSLETCAWRIQKALIDTIRRFCTWCCVLRSWASSEKCPRRVRCPPLTQARAVPFDRGSVEREIVHERKITLWKIHTGDQTEKYQFVYATYLQKSNALSTGSDYCDGSSPSPWPFTMRTGDKEPSGSISHHMDHAHVECILDDTPIEARIWHSNGIHSLKLRIQQSLGMGS